MQLKKMFGWIFVGTICGVNGAYAGEISALKYFPIDQLTRAELEKHTIPALEVELTRTNEHLGFLKFKRALLHVCCCRRGSGRLNYDIHDLENRSELIQVHMKFRAQKYG